MCSQMVSIVLLLIASVATGLQAAEPAPAEPWLRPDPAALKRWQDMRFGMFIHWGPVSLTGHEIGWSRGAQTPIADYDNLYKNFNPEKFNAEEWVSVARAAGMKYIVLTTKHHDGFCIFDTKLTDFNIMNSPFKRDVTRELADACGKQGIAFGTYHSVCDWHHPDFPLTSPGGKIKRDKSDIEAYRKYLRGQVTELIKNYGPLVTMWFDVPQQFDRSEGSINVKLCRELQPDILVNNRAGGGMGDYDTPEQRVGGFNIDRPWETCMTICRQWSWKPDDTMKTLPECLQTLIRTAGGDGNLLFNVGPTAEGIIEQRQIDRLKEMGAWLTKHGQSIYSTRGGPYKPAKYLACTRRDNTVYLHVLAWPDETLKLPALPAKILKSSVLTGGQATVSQTEAGIEITVAKADRQEIDTIIALEIDKPAMELPPIALASVGQSLTEGKKATASNVYQKSNRYAAAMAVDGDAETRWATDAGTKQCWLEVDLGKPLTFDRFAVSEYEPRVQSYELQMKDGDEWKTFHKATTLGTQFEGRFPPVTARHVRLNILDASNGPTIHEFQLFAPVPEKKP